MTSIQRNTEYDYNTTTLQIGFRRKSNDLFESVFHAFFIRPVIFNFKIFCFQSHFYNCFQELGNNQNNISLDPDQPQPFVGSDHVRNHFCKCCPQSILVDKEQSDMPRPIPWNYTILWNYTSDVH